MIVGWVPERSEETQHVINFVGFLILTSFEFGIRPTYYPNSPEGRGNMLDCASGWGEALTLLKFYLEHGIVYTPPEKPP